MASIYGRILSDLGLLSNGQVVVKNPSDFLGSVLGGSEKNTAAILDATRGKVLVIDEAYGLHSKGTPDPFKVGQPLPSGRRMSTRQQVCAAADSILS